MSTSRGRLWLLLAATMAAAVPVAFGFIRAVTTGDDVRYLWMAGAAILGSMAVVPWRRTGPAASKFPIRRGIAAIACATACAAATAVLQGARSVPSVTIVAVSFGLCTGTSAVCAMLARDAHLRGTA